MNEIQQALEQAINFAPEQNEITPSDYQSASPPAWPELPEAALYGLAGEITETATADSEADPAAVLGTVLIYAGAYFGTAKSFPVGDTKHYPRTNAVVAGASAKARKGTSFSPVNRVFEAMVETFGIAAIQVSQGPLSSGEGLAYAVRDASEKKDKEGNPEDPGVTDKRLLVVEGELGAPLRAMQREGNTLSAIIRTAWDHGNISPLTKSNRIKATGAHICVIGHITKDELSELLKSSDIWNGFANRFLWVCSRRTKRIPVPRPMDNDTVKDLAKRLAAAVRHSRVEGVVSFHPDAITIWNELYTELSKDGSGIFGTVTARAEAQVIRLALIYCLLDQQSIISVEHLRAAIAFWQYCRDSAAFIFGTAASDPDINRILSALAEGPKTQTQLNNLFGGHISGSQLNNKLGHMQALGQVTQHKNGGGRGKGRAITTWELTPGFIPPYAEMEE